MSTIIGLTKSEVLASTATPDFAVGTLGETGNLGTKQYLYVHAQEVVTAAGYICVIDSDFEAEMTDLASTAPGAGAGFSCGAAMAAVADNEFFWIQVYGKGSVRVLTDCAVGTALYCTATSGALDDVATSGLEHIVGIVLGTVAGGAPETNADAYFNFPYVGDTA